MPLVIDLVFGIGTSSALLAYPPCVGEGCARGTGKNLRSLLAEPQIFVGMDS